MKRVGDKHTFKHRIPKEIVKINERIIVKLDGSDKIIIFLMILIHKIIYIIFYIIRRNSKIEYFTP